ncbi:MAG: branched-chain amino acid ABC transporter permease [Chloroflexi bacterium]|nr:MAG: branched-chain amino acid ABC transporter permease [Chloroflexota bacterium]
MSFLRPTLFRIPVKPASLVAPATVALVTALLILIPFERSNGDTSGVISFLVSFLTFVAIYAIFTLGLNVQWGYSGVFNFGVLGFFMLGAYTAAIVTKEPASGNFTDYIGGFGGDLDLLPWLSSDEWLPHLVGLAAAAGVAGLAALLLAVPTLRLRGDYLAIATIGVAEVLRRVVIEETWLVNGTRGLTGVPRPLGGLVDSSDYKYLLLAICGTFLVLIYLLIERAIRSPWGRVLMALREDEMATEASGKNVFAFKMQSFVMGAAIMGAGGAIYAYASSSLTPEVFTHFFATFLFWAMLILGGSGNNRGAIVGAYVLWGFWTITLQFQSYDLPDLVETRMPYVRELVLGTLIVAVLLVRPAGLLPQRRQVSVWVERQLKRRPPSPSGSSGADVELSSR